jgi:uncharacterized protein (DUF1684 family)
MASGMRCPSAALAVALLALATFSAGCANGRAHTAASIPEDWPRWQQKRLQSIAGTNGWATLVGLHWIPEGRSVLGSDPSAALRLPAGRAPGVAGEILRTGKHVEYSAAAAGSPVIRLSADSATNEPPVLKLGELRMFVIVRGERLALRVKDPQAPTRVHFKGLQYFPYSRAWKLEGRWEPAGAGQTVTIADVTGASAPQPLAGLAHFTVNGTPLTLAAVEDDETHDLWFIFRDGTSGVSTYGGGRFLHAAKPGPEGVVTLDFNFAYNPPCAFTPFATCPVSPRQNWLPVPISAGERKYAGTHE